MQSLPLLRQSVERNTAGPILWYGPYVDFGSFGETLRSGSKSDTIVLRFKLGIERDRHFARANLLDSSKVEVAIFLEESTSNTTRAKSCEITGWGHSIRLEYEKDKVTSFKVNNTNVLDWGSYIIAQHGVFLPIPASKQGKEEDTYDLPERLSRSLRFSLRRYYRSFNSHIFHRVKKELDPAFHGRTTQENRYKIALNLGFGSDKSMHRQLENAYDSDFWERSMRDNLGIRSRRFNRLSDANIALSTPVLIECIDNLLSDLMQEISYVAPVRAAAERYYRRQDLNVSEIDPQGTNLAMFIRGLSKRERDSFRNWTQENLGFRVFARSGGGHISVHMQEGNQKEYNLADMGFGFSQIVPIVAQLWDKINRPSDRSGSRTRVSRVGRGYSFSSLRGGSHQDQVIFAIEQPELHLHPALQARLADLLIDIVKTAKEAKLNPILVVETHSSTIINRIGNHIALASPSEDSGFQASDAHVVMFERESASLSDVRTSSFTEDGGLDAKWPYGFFEPELM